MKRLLCVFLFLTLLGANSLFAAFIETPTTGPCQPGQDRGSWTRVDVWNDNGTPNNPSDDIWWGAQGVDCWGISWENDSHNYFNSIKVPNEEYWDLLKRLRELREHAVNSNGSTPIEKNNLQTTSGSNNRTATIPLRLD